MVFCPGRLMVVFLPLLAGIASATATSSISLILGSDTPAAVATRLETLLNVSPAAVCDPHAALCLSIGNTSVTHALIPPASLSSLSPESFVVRTAPPALLSSVSSSQTVIAGIGTPSAVASFPAAVAGESIGTGYAAYAILEEALGFSFSHPLAPSIPASLEVVPVNLTESPFWSIRSWHIHTEHPLELADVLNGFIATGDGYLETWDSMLPQVTLAFEWLLANRQNRVEWLVLWAEAWGEFAVSPLRRERLRTLVNIAHSFGLMAGPDCAIAEQQQHGWYMVSAKNSTEASQHAAIAQHIDWLFNDTSPGFDFLSTESGLSEFTAPNDVLMLNWINYTANYLNQTYNRPSYIKCHCSTGQTCPNYTDPRTGQPLNFNFLPIYATEDMGVMPHTVQLYGFDDPAGDTYGNTNFEYMLEFMLYVAKAQPNRPNIYHGETNYWVSYDIDVPLSLPLYGDRRLYDYRTIMTAERTNGVKIDGVNNFDSGWEWGSWLQDVMTARAAWDPASSATTHQEALTQSLTSAFRVFGDAAPMMVAAYREFIAMERQLLIHGLDSSANVTTKRNGMAYMAGIESFAELEALLTGHTTQPIRVPPSLAHASKDPTYSELRALLVALESGFNEALSNITRIQPHVPALALPLYLDLLDSANITALRASTNVLLYDAAVNKDEGTLHEVLQSIDVAATIVQRREAAYRVPVERIAGWRDGPTAYSYGYVWTVHSLFYWWRDYGRVANLFKSDKAWRVLSPCYLNIERPADVATGNEKLEKIAELFRELFGNTKGLDALADCAAPPTTEPLFPRDL